MGFRIFVTGSGIARDALDFLESERCILMQGDPKDSAADIAKKVANFAADALIVRQGNINAEVIAASTNMRVICKHGSGTDNIDINAASALNIPVMFTPDATTESVAEHTLALMLSLFREIPDQNMKIRRGIFDKTCFGGQEIFGKTLGLVGFGRVARRLCELVAPFDMSVIVFHPSFTEEVLPSFITKVSSLDDLLIKADIVSLHIPLSADTRGMINSAVFDKMKNDAYLINTARGQVVNEQHLIKALQDGQIKGAGIDTFNVEPPAYGNPLFTMNNVVLTMHTAGNSDSSLKKMAQSSAHNVLAVLKNNSPDPRLIINLKLLSARRQTGG